METSVNADIPGLPVEIGLIEKELGKLWEESADTKTRASLINLVLYTESARDIEKNTHLIADLASQHAFRAIVVLAQSSAAESGARAWISAHCHPTTVQGKFQICSEQITFQLDGDAVASLPNIVFSHLESDLPLCLWWQAEFPERTDISLWRLVDRLIFDSSTWEAPQTQGMRIREIIDSRLDRIVLCDLNWTRLLHARFAIASLFDHSSALPYLRKIHHIELHHAPGAQTTALLLLGWLAVRLGWHPHQPLLSSHLFLSPSGTYISFHLREQPGPMISLCRLKAENASFQFQRQIGSAFYQTEMTGADLPHTEHLLAAGKEDPVDILVEELGRTGKHPHYCQALKTIFPLLRTVDKIP